MCGLSASLGALMPTTRLNWSVCAYFCVHLCMHTHTCTWILCTFYASIYTRACTFMYACMLYVHIYLCVCVCVYIYIYIYIIYQHKHTRSNAHMHMRTRTILISMPRLHNATNIYTYALTNHTHLDAPTPCHTRAACTLAASRWPSSLTPQWSGYPLTLQWSKKDIECWSNPPHTKLTCSWI